MPYLIGCSNKSGDSVAKSFYPSMPTQRLSATLFPQRLTQEDKEAISRTLLIEPKGNGAPEVIGWNIGPWIVSSKLRDKIDELEPDVHEFIPLQVKRNDGTEEYGIYNLILLQQYIEAIVYQETRFAIGLGLEGAKASGYSLYPYGPCALKADAIKGRHLWRGADKMIFSYFCSDELGDFYLQEKMRGWRLQKCDVKA